MRLFPLRYNPSTMAEESLQERFREVERLEKAGYFLKAVALLRRLARTEIPLEEIHKVHLRLADLYRHQGLDEQADREVLAVAAHWVEEGRVTEARALLAKNEHLLPGGIASMGEIPGDPESARDALLALIRGLQAPQAPQADREPTPADDDLLPGLKGAGKLPALPASAGSKGPRVPLPAAALDPGRQGNTRSPIDEHIERVGALVQSDPGDVKNRIKLAELLLKAGRHSDGIAHLVLAAVHFEKAGEPHKAVQVYKRVLEVAPERRELHNRLGDIYTHLGLLAEAATEYKKAEIKQP